MSIFAIKSPNRRSFFLGMLLFISALLAFVALLSPLLARMMSPSMEAGQVATQDILAPEAITYVSEVLTEQKRETAARSVLPVYTPPDTSVARQQLEGLRSALAYITSVRADPYATVEQKLDDMAALDDFHINQETAANILALSEARWQTVQQEAIVVLEQVMRSTIRSERLEDARNSVPTLVSLALPEAQADIVAELVAAFVAPNSLLSESMTEAARQKAQEAATPVSRSFVTGETVVTRGRVLNEADVEALQQLGLAQPQTRWQDPTSAAALVALMLCFMVFYMRRTAQAPSLGRGLVLIAALFLAFLFAARLTIAGHTVIPYAFPLPAFGLLVAVLFGAELALVFSLPLSIMVAFGLPNALDLTVYFVMSSLFGVLALGQARRLTSFFWAGLAVAAAGAVVVVAYRLPLPSTDWLGLTTLLGAALFNGLAAASLTMVMQFFLAQFIGIATPMQLMELTRPDHPLLQVMLRDAPGTYQHSLQVANLAEQAAESIRADTLLTRVGALYHDIGKALNPQYFIENQLPGFLNPHDDLDPATSAATIIRHVTDGLHMARKYRLPPRLSDFIAEHHGSMLTRYQWVRAVTAAGGDESKVDKVQFRYPGPRPQSRETAILMLADGCEARVRAERPKDESELLGVIKSVIEICVSTEQLDDTDLTLRDLEMIAQSFIATLRGVYHPRVPYPKLEAASSEATVPIAGPVAHKTKDVTVGSKVDTSSVS